jgi:hypothetical protein
MRIRLIRKPTETSIDGIQLDRFQIGLQYEVGTSLGAVMLAEQWAEPVPIDAPVVVTPFSEADPFAPAPFRDRDAPPNLVREHYPPYIRDLAIAADLNRIRRRR